jgi:hypothetical protein
MAPWFPPSPSFIFVASLALTWVNAGASRIGDPAGCRQRSHAMGWSSWPTPWVFLAPLMMALMVLCMAGMCPMMRRMSGGHDQRSGRAAWDPGDPAHVGPNVPARYPDGASAFEEYRAETLRHLDQEQHDFHDFVGRLRDAKDKAEFDRFIAERRGRPGPPG